MRVEIACSVFLLRMHVMIKEYITTHTRHVRMVIHAAVVLEMGVDGGSDKTSHFGPHTMLHPEPHRLHPSANQPLEKRHIQLIVLSQMVCVDRRTQLLVVSCKVEKIAIIIIYSKMEILTNLPIMISWSHLEVNEQTMCDSKTSAASSTITEKMIITK